jgi:hypothetical protein
MRYVAVSAILLLCLICLAVLFREQLPYGIRDFKVIEAIALRNQIKGWRYLQRPLNYGFTNQNEKCYLLFTNLVLSGTNTVEIIMALESNRLPSPGCLVGTDSGKVFWFNGKTVELVKFAVLVM